MIRLRLFTSVSVICVIPFLISCNSTGKIKKNGKALTGFETVYVNDSLKISSTFFGDFVPVTSNKEIRIFKRHDGLRVNNRYNLALYRRDFPDTILPDFHYYILYFPSEHIAARQLSLSGTYDFSPGVKTDAKRNRLIKFIYPDKDGLVAFVAVCTTDNFIRMQKEFNDYVFTKIKTGANYKLHPTENTNNADSFYIVK